jgi:hypothetical protein
MKAHSAIDSHGSHYRSFKLYSLCFIDSDGLTVYIDGACHKALNKSRKDDLSLLLPKRAAMKIFNSWSRSSLVSNVDATFSIQETTRGSASHQKIYTYFARRSSLPNKNIVIVNNNNAKAKEISHGFKTTLYALNKKKGKS